MRNLRENSRSGIRAAVTLALGVGGGALATPASAQNADEIIVTATQREASLQDVPVAVTPVTREMIDNAGIRDVQDLTSIVPSLQFNVSESENSATARLRGIGTQGSNVSLESAVGIFVDGVYRARNGIGLSELGDVAQIEVLRGPQGTLFGRNTTAGLITITTRSPDLNALSANGEATFGDFNEAYLSVGVNIPLVQDVVAVSFYASLSERDGFMNINPDGANRLLASGRPNDGRGEANTRSAHNLRAQMLWQLSPTADFRLIADYSERNESCCAAQIYNPALLNGNPVTNLNAAGVEGAPIPYGTLRMQWIANLGGYGPNVSASSPLGAQGAGDIGARTGFANAGYPTSVEDFGLSGELSWEVAGSTTLTSITAFRQWTSGAGADSDYSQADIVYVPQGDINETQVRAFTQEFRLAGQTGRLDWLVGAYYSHEEITRDFAFRTGSQYGAYFAGLDSLITGGSVGVGLGVAPTGGTGATLYNALATIPANVGSYDRFQQDGESIALFTHNIFALTDRTDLTVGLRFTHEEKDLVADFSTSFDAGALMTTTVQGIAAARGLPYSALAPFDNCTPTAVPSGTLAPLAPVFAVLRSGYCVSWLRNDLDAIGYDQQVSYDEWSGVIALQHAFTDDIIAYASYSRGYKAGGVNFDRNFDFTYLGGEPGTPFAAELVDSFEVGLKTQWFDRALTLNGAVFHSVFENFQLNTFNGVQFTVTSAPEVISDGAEIDMIWRTPIRGLTMQGGVSYVDARYGDDTGLVASNANPITGELTLARLPGSQLTNAPEWTATTALTYRRPLFNGSLAGLAYLDARWVDDQNTGSDLRPSKLQPAYTLVNGRIGIGSLDERWSLELWGRNLFDEDYAQIMFDVPLQQGAAGPTQGAFLGDPRSFGVTFRARF
jgi:outer membrane receptor protein involved in Fe transport